MKRMRMVAVACVLLGLVGSARADEISKREKIHEMFQILKLPQTFDQVQNSALAQGEQFMNGLTSPDQKPTAAEQKVIDEFRAELPSLLKDTASWATLEPQFEELYYSVYSEDDLDGILTFYRSAAGQSMLAKTPELMTRSQAISQKLLTDLQPKVKATVEKFSAKYAGVKKQEAAQ